jgi:hypothetical protein
LADVSQWGATMFIRFRERWTKKHRVELGCDGKQKRWVDLTRLSVNVIETHRKGGKIRHQHVRGLASILTPPTDEQRYDYWCYLRSTMAQPSNRISPAQWELLAASIAARIPRPDAATELAILRKRRTDLQTAMGAAQNENGLLKLAEMGLVTTQKRIAELEAAQVPSP